MEKIKKPRKRKVYQYNFNGTIVTCAKELHIRDGVYCHRQGDFMVPLSRALFYKIMMAQLGAPEKPPVEASKLPQTNEGNDEIQL